MEGRMVVGELYAQLLAARERIGGSATVRANVAAMGSNMGTTTVVRATTARVAEMPPHDPEHPPMRGCPDSLLPGPKLVLMVGGEDWEDPESEDLSDSPEEHWERLMAPCATIDQILRDLQDVPMSWDVAASYAMPGCTPTEDSGATVEICGQDVSVADIASAVGDALYPDGMLQCYAPGWSEEYAPRVETWERRDWFRPDGTILSPGEGWTDDMRLLPTGEMDSCWNTGTRAHFFVQVWS